MSNMLDYIEWRGDIPFTAAPFNEVDNLVLARLSYIPLNGIINGFNDKLHTLPPAAVKKYRILQLNICRSTLKAHYPDTYRHLPLTCLQSRRFTFAKGTMQHGSQVCSTL